MIKRLKRFVMALLLGTLAVSAFVAWSGITGRELPWPIPNGPGSDVVGSDSHFGDLRVIEGDLGDFDGAIVVENPTDDFQEVFVTVALFDGDENVGKLFGTVTLKPSSESSVDLLSTDGYGPWSDAHVDLLRSSS